MATTFSLEEAYAPKGEATPTDSGVFSLEDAYAVEAPRKPSDWEMVKKAIASTSMEEFQDANLFMQLGASIYKHATGQTTEGSLTELTPLAKEYAVKMGMRAPDVPWYKTPAVLAEKFAENPMTTLVELGKGILYDPELLVVAAANAPKLTMRILQGAAIGGGITGAQSLAQQSVLKDSVDLNEASGAAFEGAVLGGVVSGAIRPRASRQFEEPAGGMAADEVLEPEQPVNTQPPEYMDTVSRLEKSPDTPQPMPPDAMPTRADTAPDAGGLPVSETVHNAADNTGITPRPVAPHIEDFILEPGNLPVRYRPREGVILPEPAALPPESSTWQAVTDFADKNLGAISTRIGEIDPQLKLALRRHEMTTLGELHTRIKEVDPFLQELNKLPKFLKAKLEERILANDKFSIDYLMEQAGAPALITEWGKVKAVLKDVGEQLQGQGRLSSLREDYFPRIVVDRPGLLRSLGLGMRNQLEKKLHEAERDAVKARGYGLTEVESSAIINKYLRSDAAFRASDKPGFSKQRVFEDVTALTRPYYASPSTSLHAYLKKATDDLETTRFFGGDTVMRTQGGHTFVDLGESIGKLIDRKLKSGEITFEQAPKLASMLQSRFGAGERRPLGAVQDVKNVAYAALLGNPISAIGQLADVGTAAYLHGMKPTLQATVSMLTGGKKVLMDDFGLVNHISEEFIDARTSARFLDKVFRVSGFNLADKFGKEVNLNAAYSKFQRDVNTSAGQAKIANKYASAFGAEFPSLLRDLKEGALTERVKLLLFSELSDVQPISKAEMPQGYLDHPNGRIIYMLKSFMLKQLDLVRREAYDEIRKGGVKKGVTNLTKYGLLLGAAGASVSKVQDFLLGKPIDFETTDVPENFFKTFGWSAYTVELAKQGHPVEAALGVATPPYKMIDDVVRADARAINYIPVVGKFLYSWEFGGKEKAAKKLMEEKLKEQRELRKKLTGRN